MWLSSAGTTVPRVKELCVVIPSTSCEQPMTNDTRKCAGVGAMATFTTLTSAMPRVVRSIVSGRPGVGGTRRTEPFGKVSSFIDIVPDLVVRSRMKVAGGAGNTSRHRQSDGANAPLSNVRISAQVAEFDVRARRVGF